jgi:ribosomal protein L24
MKIKKNDLVKVISGNAKGSEGKVLKVFPDTGRIIVEKVHLIKRHTRKQQGSGGAAQGGIVDVGHHSRRQDQGAPVQEVQRDAQRSEVTKHNGARLGRGASETGTEKRKR